MRFITGLFLMFFVLSSVSAKNDLILKRNQIRIVMSDFEPEPLKRAVEDLKRDFRRVMSSSVRVNSEIINDKNLQIVIVNDQTGALKLDYSKLKQTAGAESHRVYADKNDNIIYLHGNDMRGAIYAIYSFSEQVLGVPPLWFWSSWRPVKKNNIHIPADFDLNFEAPQVKYRAWFPNDQDLILSWRKLHEENNTAWLETMLRLKLNTVELMATVFYSTNGTTRISTEADLVSRYGLIVSTTHTVAMGSHFGSWNTYWSNIRKTKAPEFLLANEDKLIEFWENAVQTMHRSGIEFIWQLSFRAHGDRAFWATFKDAPESDEERAEVINRMWAIQYDMVRRITREDAPHYRITLYNELSDFMAAGLLRLPSTENLILNYVATRRDHYPNDDMVNFNVPDVNIGYYLNLQFTSTGAHLAQAEGPWKMEFNYRFVNSKAPLYFSMINVGNQREFLLGMAANAVMMWDFDAYETNQYLLEFCETYFGKKHKNDIAKLYRDFFLAYWEQKQSDFPGLERQYLFQDLRYKQAMRTITGEFSKKDYNPNPLPVTEFRFYNIVPEQNNADNQIDAIINGMTTTIQKFEDVAKRSDAMYRDLPKAYRQFFHDNLRSQAYFMLEISKSLLHLAEANKARTSNKELAREHIQKSLNAMISARNHLYSNQKGVFVGWYQGDGAGGKFNMPDIISRIEKAQRQLQ